MSSLLRFVFNLSFFILIINSSLAQSNSFVFHKLGMKDGLSESTVRTISEDQKGFMWFGSENGLNRYDGYNFTVYLNQKDDPYSISSNQIKYIFNDSKGNLWIGTRHGLNLYDPLKNRFYNGLSDTLVALQSVKGDIESILEDSKGILWVTVNGVGLFKIESLQKSPILFQFSDTTFKNRFLSSAEDSKHNLWIGTEDGLLYFDTKQNTTELNMEMDTK
jgi:two-component system sensor histidine kinase ChiS